MFTHGEVGGNDIENIIEMKKFGENESKIIHPKKVNGGHLGGDIGIMKDFLKAIEEENYNARTSALKSIESHLMAFAAEDSRLSNKVIELDSFLEEKYKII